MNKALLYDIRQIADYQELKAKEFKTVSFLLDIQINFFTDYICIYTIEKFRGNFEAKFYQLLFSHLYNVNTKCKIILLSIF